MRDDERFVAWKECLINDNMHPLTWGDDRLTGFTTRLVIKLSHLVDPDARCVDDAACPNGLGQTRFDILGQNPVDAIVRVMQ